VLAALRRRDEQFRNWLMGAMTRASSDPCERLLALFDALDDWFNGRALYSLGFHGCAFINAAGEYSSPDDPVHRTCAEHKRLIVEFLRKLASEAGAADPVELAEQLAILKDGAIVTAQVQSQPKAALRAKAIAKRLIEEARKGRARQSA
jgi:hypothetical protein